MVSESRNLVIIYTDKSDIQAKIDTCTCCLDIENELKGKRPVLLYFA